MRDATKNRPGRLSRARAGAALLAMLWLAAPAWASESFPTSSAPSALAPFVAIFGALIAAAVGLFNVRTNQRFNLRSQKDSQFYEALKRFGEQSPSVRSSAAGLLAQMAVAEFATTTTGVVALRRRAATKPYLTTAFDQLATGLLLEDDQACIGSNASALRRLIPEMKEVATEKVRTINLDAQDRMCDLQARLWALWGADALPRDPADARWRRAAYYAGLPAWVLSRLLRNHARDFVYRLRDYEAGFAPLGDDERRALQLRLRDEIRVCGARLVEARLLAVDAIVHAAETDAPRRRFTGLYLDGARFRGVAFDPCSFAGSVLSRADLGKARVRDCVFSDADLEDAFLVNASLEGATFHRTHLSFANLERARLAGAKLYGARVDLTTRLERADWWRADFYSRRDHALDKPLLDLLFARYGEAVPREDGEVHLSVVEYRNRYPVERDRQEWNRHVPVRDAGEDHDRADMWEPVSMPAR